MRKKNAEKLIDELRDGQVLRAWIRLGKRDRGWNVFGRGAIRVAKFSDEEGKELYNVEICDTVWDENSRCWRIQGAINTSTVTREKAVEALAFYGDYRTVKIY